MSDWDRHEVNAQITGLLGSVSKLVGQVTELEHKIGHLYKRFDASKEDDAERWGKLYAQLKERFAKIERKIEGDSPEEIP